MTDLERTPVLRVVPGPSDINANGHIFGGWVLSQMDIAAGIVASRRARGPVATVAIEAMKFLAPIHLRDVISVYANVERVGRTSMSVRIEIVAQRDLGATEVKGGRFRSLELGDATQDETALVGPDGRPISVPVARIHREML
jgi:acyl-CoA thioesterase YciA